jgi:hypothetical protein
MRLSSWLQRQKLKQTDLAKKLNTGKARAHRIYHGKILPKPNEVVFIYRWSKGVVQPNDFYDLADPGEFDGLPLFVNGAKHDAGKRAS